MAAVPPILAPHYVERLLVPSTCRPVPRRHEKPSSPAAPEPRAPGRTLPGDCCDRTAVATAAAAAAANGGGDS